MDLALEAPDLTIGARMVWREWGSVEHRIPPDIQTRIVNHLDAKLQAGGFPSLCTLVA